MPTMARTMHTEESAEVEVLLANMEKLKILTKKISSSLSTLDDGGRGLQSSIRPIYGNTGRLQNANQNIESVRLNIGRLREDREKQRREGGTIRSGINNVPLMEYTAALDRTNASIKDLRNNPSANGPAIDEMSELMRMGGRELEGLFQDTLRQDSSPIEPLSYVLKGNPFPTIGEEHTSTLRNINSYMMNSPSSSFRDSIGEPRTLHLYADTRSTYLSQTLHNLASASISTARKTDPSALYRPGQSGIGQYCKALEDLIASEHDSICAIFAREQWTPLHSRTVRPALEEFSSALRELNEHVKKHLITDCLLAYEIVDLVSRLSVRLDSRNSELKPLVQESLRPIRSTAQRSISELISDASTRVQTIQALPSDASPVQVTYDVMARLQAMTVYLTPLGSLLASAEGAMDVGIDSESLFANYIANTLDALLSALDSKSRGLLKTRAAQGVFMANNLAVIDRGLTSAAFTLIPQEGIRTKLTPWRRKGGKAYVDTWADLARNLQDQFHTSSKGSGRPPSGATPNDSAAFVKSLSSKERDNIKARFGSFNTGLEELVARHKGFRIENEIRGEIAREIQEFIQPYYERFWDRYHEIDKGKGKHAKYDKQSLGMLLAGL